MNVIHNETFEQTTVLWIKGGEQMKAEYVDIGDGPHVVINLYFDGQFDGSYSHRRDELPTEVTERLNAED
jgi:hypothetical protein